MHNIEPYYNWKDIYSAEEDELSPFYKRTYSEFEFSNQIYNYYIHPQWDEFGSSTMYMKILFVDYSTQFAVIELIGEWNDALHNDIMILKREIIDVLIEQKITRFMLIGENVLNFHASDDCYYEEWYEDISDEGGWIAAVNFREHVYDEMKTVHLEHYLYMSEKFSDINWRTVKPQYLPDLIEGILLKRLAPGE
ncbi:hypothetical protein LBMAG27_23880 [Bacteroidota bacterium]|nr:hypothetical protein LBMAG27_23880 [Bacteroidota bacterium]